MRERQPLGRRVIDWLKERTDGERYLRMFSAAFLYTALDDRLAFREALQKALKKPVPLHALRSTMCFGGTALLLFVNQVITGVLLTVYYEPSPERAYETVQYITNEIPLGWLVRQMHAWGAHLMIIFVMLHMIKVYINKAYRAPRELTWVVGVLLLFITVIFGFTGYLLPWDQLSYWATKVGTGLAAHVPVVGHYILVLLRGGDEVTGITLSRFFTLHCIVLPWVAVALMGAHFVIVRRLGISEPL